MLFAGGSVAAAAGKMLYLQPDKIIKKLRREQRSKTHVIGHIGTQLGTPQLCVGETPCIRTVVLLLGPLGRSPAALGAFGAVPQILLYIIL